ncbi:hypothetical protein [Candidatus Chlorohelix sp.]|uniref:hypothetical protein n=1 Tax=Candidatus Chlorohelix sp. TaxID=3139201 RepID=UPI0030296581
MHNNIEAERSYQLDAWINSNREQILVETTQAIKHSDNTHFQDLSEEVLFYLTERYLPFSCFQPLNGKEYATFAAFSLKRGACLEEELKILRLFYRTLESIIWHDRELEISLRQFMCERIQLTGTLVSAGLTTAHLKCLMSGSYNQEALNGQSA